ncbi:hypothetical protein [Aedoeadaptatus coli]|uniref:hypothetical protein n=1 Tax=Aedoeadaptatus coli TaxID=2058292 RepID=UPI000D560F48|nr:hypothetical protein [Peptoniphilus coli]
MKSHGKNRIDNLQWAGAENYGFSPVLYGEDLAGNPDFYLNLILGLAAKYFGADTLERLFSSWSGQMQREKYDLFALYLLEEWVYGREVDERPVLSDLRIDFARRFLDDAHDLRRRTLALRVPLFYAMEMKRTHDILGRPYKKLNKKEAAIYDALRLPEDTTAENLVARVPDLFARYLHYREHTRRLPPWLPAIHLFSIPGYISIERSNVPAMFHREGEGGDMPVVFNFLRRMKKDREEEIEKTFGKNLFSDEKSLALNRAICTEGHRKSRIYFTRGIDEKDKSADQDLNARTVRRHLMKFQENKNSYNRAISDLTRAFKLKLASVTTLDGEVARRGKLISRRAFRAEISNRAAIFERKNMHPGPSFRVDLILDASASLLAIESTIAIEAYILSKSLENNGIQNRILCYQTVEDTTVITILKDYDDDADMKKIFRYKSMGWNRDGLFFKAYPVLLDTKAPQLSIVLTDANPCDFHPLTGKGLRLNKSYFEGPALDDTARYLDALARKNVKILALLNSDHVDNAEKLYRHRFVKIQKIEQIAHVAGKWIQKELVKMN